MSRGLVVELEEANKDTEEEQEEVVEMEEANKDTEEAVAEVSGEEKVAVLLVDWITLSKS